jgi:hypothetical protein
MTKNNPTKGMKPSEAMVERLISDDNFMNQLSDPYGPFEDWARDVAASAIAALPDHMAILDRLCEMMGVDGYYTSDQLEAIAAAAEWKKQWSAR